MRVFSSVRGTVKDGRMEEAAALAGEAARLVGRHGGVRLLLVTAGDDADTTRFNVEYENPDAMGRAFDKLTADSIRGIRASDMSSILVPAERPRLSRPPNSRDPSSVGGQIESPRIRRTSVIAGSRTV